MTKYKAIVLIPGSDGEGRYEFEAPNEFIQNSPARVVDMFLNTVEGLNLPGEVLDSEINAAHNYRDIRTVTASGSIFFKDGGTVPFLTMIFDAENSDQQVPTQS